jgi:tetratricopeptide (TPR) repeat protein
MERKMNVIRPVVLALVLLSFAQCTKPKETTAVGAAAGGVVGAGLGAIVGAQTGSTGAGLAIGTAAGAATGALIGNALQAKEEADRTQDEAIERQQQMIAAHGRELDEYKRARDGGPGRSGVGAGTSRGSVMGYSYPGSSMKLSPSERQRLMRGEQPTADSTRGRYSAVKTTQSASNTQPTRRATRPEPRLPAHSAGIVEGSLVAARAVSEPVIDRSAAVKTEAKAVIEAGTATTDSSGLTERSLAVAEETHAAVADTSETVAGFKSPSKELIPALPTEKEVAHARDEAALAAEGQGDAVAKVGQALAPNSEECQRAEEEVTKAGASKEVADKLFHYRRALRLCPGNAEYHLGLGNVYKSLNRTADAEFEYREALRINPSMTVARESLDKLRF